MVQLSRQSPEQVIRFSTPRSRSVTRTIRIDEDVDRQLNDLATREKISVNLIANKALRKHVEWDAYSEKFGLLTISRRLFKTLISRLSEDEARELGRRSGTDGGPELVTFWFKKFNLENTLKAFEQLSSKYSNLFEFEHGFDGKSHTIVMKHNSGINASHYYAESIRAVFGLLGMKSEIVEIEDQIIATITPVKN